MKADGTPRPRARFVAVAVPAPLLEPLSYRVPEAITGRVTAGTRVRIPLGRRTVTGVVLGDAPPPPPEVEAKDLLGLLDAKELPPDLVETIRWTAEYYVAPPGDAARAAVPSAARPALHGLVRLTSAGRTAAALPGAPAALRWIAGRPGMSASEKTLRTKLGGEKEWATWRQAGWIERLAPAAPRGALPLRRVFVPSPAALSDPVSAFARLARAPAQYRVLEAALAGTARTSSRLASEAGASSKAVQALVRAGLLEMREEQAAPAAVAVLDLPHSDPPQLTEEQDAACTRLGTLLEDDTFRPALLFGVTGSGKTEVYLRTAARTLARGRPVLFLVPEIGLTPRLAHALVTRFGRERVVVLHSGMTDAQRYDAWKRAGEGRAEIVVGARSAIFAPLVRPGLIVVDEEHDSGYKQEETPRYHARDLALVRGRAAGAVVLLGSATPSLEAWSLAESGGAELLELPRRIGNRGLATVEIIDMRREFAETGDDAPLSRRLAESLRETVAAGEQAMVLLNRRGHTPVLLCRACGEAAGCPHCSIALTWHQRSGRMRCHYCGHASARPDACPTCSSVHLAELGAGTQRLEDEVARAVPGCRVERLDRDAVRSAGKLVNVLDRFARGDIDVLVGTQMIAKGHHFPRVTLVGVISADASLRLPDFRASERTFQLITQVAGRAGRGDRPGRVVVQAFRPEHPAVALAASQDFREFAARELPSRRMLHYPPAAAMANLIVRDRSQEAAYDNARRLAAALRKRGEGNVAVLGPTAAPIYRLRELWRVQMLVRARKRRRLIMAIKGALADVASGEALFPRWVTVDIDPQQLL